MQYTFSASGLTFVSPGQSDDAEVMSIIELSTTAQKTFFATWGKYVKIKDLRVPNSPVQVHQYGLWFTGAKKPGNLYVTDLNPNQAGRLRFEEVETVYIAPGTQFQIKTAQQSGTGTSAPEATVLAFTYSYEAPPQ